MTVKTMNPNQSAIHAFLTEESAVYLDYEGKVIYNRPKTRADYAITRSKEYSSYTGHTVGPEGKLNTVVSGTAAQVLAHMAARILFGEVDNRDYE